MRPVIASITSTISDIIHAQNKSPDSIQKTFPMWFRNQGITPGSQLNPNALTSDGTPLIIKSITSPADDNYSIFHALLKLGASTNVRDNKGTPLLFYVVKQAPHLIPQLKMYQCDFNAMDSDGNTVLFLPINSDTALELIDSGTVPDARNIQGKTALFYPHTSECIRTLASAGSNFNIKDLAGKTALFYAHDIDFLKALVAAGADPNIQDDEGKTPLFAIPPDKSFLDMARILVDAGADIHITDFSGNIAPVIQKFGELLTPDKSQLNRLLNEAVFDCNNEKVSDLLKLGADPNIRHEYMPNLKMLSLAVKQNAAQIIQLLGEAGANPNDPSVSSPLVLAIQKQYPKCITALLNIGAEVTSNVIKAVNCIDFRRLIHYFPLFYRSIDAYSNDEALRRLYTESASSFANKSDNEGKTAIFCCHYVESIDLLEQCHANFHITDTAGKTPLFYIAPASWNAYELADKFIQCGVDPSIRDNDGNTADIVTHLEEMKEKSALNARLDEAVNYNDLQQAADLLNNGADPTYRHKYNRNWNMLMLAIYNQNLEMLRLLANAGADVNELVNNHTPLKWAITRNSSECVEVLLELGAKVSYSDLNSENVTPQIQALLKQAVGYH